MALLLTMPTLSFHSVGARWSLRAMLVDLLRTPSVTVPTPKRCVTSVAGSFCVIFFMSAVVEGPDVDVH